MSTTIVPTVEELAVIRRERYRKAAEQIRQWSVEDCEYDERVGTLLEGVVSFFIRLSPIRLSFFVFG